MRKSIESILNALSDADNADLQVMINGPVSNEFKRPECSKRSNGIYVRDKTRFRQTCSDPNHVLLGHANIKKTVGKFFRELFDDQITQVTSEQNHTFIS